MRYRPLFVILLFAAAFALLFQKYCDGADREAAVKITVSSGGGGSVGPRPPRVVATRKVAPTVIRETTDRACQQPLRYDRARALWL